MYLQDTEGIFFSWWRHQMETFSALLVIRAGLTGLRWIPHTKASDAELWCFLWSVSKKRLRKQSRGWWIQTQLSPLWRNRNVCSLSYVVEHLYGICGMQIIISVIRSGNSIISLLLSEAIQNFLYKSIGWRATKFMGVLWTCSAAALILSTFVLI